MASVVPLAEELARTPEAVLPFPAFLRFSLDGDRQEYEGWYFGRRRRLEVFALAVLSGDDRFLKPLETVLAAVCEEFTWALPAHVNLAQNPETTVDLFAAETASALAEVLGLAGARINPVLGARILREIDRRVLGSFRDRAPAWGWETQTHNWAAVCAGGVGLAALWTVSDAGDLARILTRLGGAFDAYLSGFPDDGLCLEGMGYWTYGFGYFTAFAELLKDRSAGGTDLLGHPDLRDRLARIARFPQAGRIGRRDFVRFSDALAEFRYPPGTVARLIDRFGGDPLPGGQAEDLLFDPCARWARHLRDFAWVPPPSQGAEPPPGTSWYPQSQWLVVRGGGPLPLGLAAKGGHNGEPHNHNDVGAFQLVAGDDVLIDDLGAGLYDRGYFGPGRYSYFVNSSRSHSVPLIDGREQEAGADRRARDTVCLATEETTRLTLDLAGAYPEGTAGSVVRTWETRSDAPWRTDLTDTFHFEAGDHAVTERFVTRLPVTLRDGAAFIAGTEATLEIRPLVPAAALTLTPEPFLPHEGPGQTAFCIDFLYRTEGPALRAAFTLTVRPLSPSETLC